MANAGKKSRVEYFSKHFTLTQGCQMRAGEEKNKSILCPNQQPVSVSKFLHIGEKDMGKMGGNWERIEKMIEDQSLKCQGMIYHLDIRRET